jgi:alcohol dehydrogenase
MTGLFVSDRNRPHMKAMILNTYGDDAKFQLTKLPRPALRPGHVLVRIAATSVNTIDTKIRKMGKALALSPDLPAVLGMDFAGTIEAAGEGVTDMVPGDEVYGCAGGLGDLQGALAEYILADARLVAHKPATLSMREAAALPLTGITAFEGLERARVQPGQKLLVQGGTGGVGHLAVQLARHAGAEVFATVSDANKMQQVEAMGATAINYKTETPAEYVRAHTGGTGFDVIFDTVGGENMAQSFEAAALNGTVVSIACRVTLDLSPLHNKGLTLHAVFMLIPMLHNHSRAAHRTILETLARQVDAGVVKPLLDASDFRLEDIGQAHDRLLSGQAIGKIVVTV